MFCSRCGKQLDPSARFCAACGASVGTAEAPPPPPFATSQMVRPRQGRMVAGVCAAFARQYGWDVTIVRIITALICLSGAGALAYFIAWILIPDEPYPLPQTGL